jgi:hypothetical protein
MSCPNNRPLSAYSYPPQSRNSQAGRRPTDASSSRGAPVTDSSGQSRNIEPDFDSPPQEDTNLPAYSQDSRSPPNYRELTQTQELIESLQSQVTACTKEASTKADASKSNRNFGSRKQLAADALLHRSMASFGGASLNYMHSGSVFHLGLAHDYLKGIVDGEPTVTEADTEFCQLRTDAFLAVVLPSVENPDLFTWEMNKRIETPYRPARRFWGIGLDSKL